MYYFHNLLTNYVSKAQARSIHVWHGYPVLLAINLLEVMLSKTIFTVPDQLSITKRIAKLAFESTSMSSHLLQGLVVVALKVSRLIECH